MSDTSWYSIVDGISLMQGDVLMACPVSVIAGPWKLPLDPKETVFETKITSLLIMTQSCDLENDKTEFVLCATITDWATNVRTEINAGNTAIKSRDFRKKVIDGNIPGLSLLHKHESSPRLEWSVANFHRLYTLPKAPYRNMHNPLARACACFPPTANIWPRRLRGTSCVLVCLTMRRRLRRMATSAVSIFLQSK